MRREPGEGGGARPQGEGPARGGPAPPHLLVYPFGMSDLQRPGGPLQRGERLADFVRQVLEADPRPAGRPPRVEWRDGGGELLATMPILGSTLVRARASLPGRGPATLHLQPILTEQEPPHPQDTWPLATLLGRLDGWVFGRVTLRVLEPWKVTCDASDFAQVGERYSELFALYREGAAAYGSRMYQLAPGTPAMTFAASVFAQDPDILFLYTPMGRPTGAMQLFLEERRRQTDRLVATLARNLEWEAAAEALLQPGNGYMPLDGRTEGNPRLAEVWAALALGAWGRRRFARAAAALERLDARGLGEPGAERAARVLARLARVLSETVRTPPSWVDVWRWSMVDAFCRLLAAWHREDLPAIVLALYAFNEACQLWALSRGEPAGEDVRLRGDLADPARRVRAILELRDRGRLDRDWAASYLVLHWCLENALDRVYDALVHGGVHLPPGLLRARLRSIGLEYRDAGQVQSALVAVASGVLRALRQLPEVPCPIAPLADSVGGGGAGEGLGRRWEEAAAASGAVLAAWAGARQAHLEREEERIRRDVEGWVGRVRERIQDELLKPPSAATGARSTRVQRWARWAVRALDGLLREPPVPAEHAIHGLVPDPDRAYLEAVIAVLAKNDGPFKTMVELGRPEANLHQVRAWVEGASSWDLAIDGYLDRLSRGRRRAR